MATSMASIVIETPDGVRRIPLDRPRLSIGRLSYNDVALPYGQISRQHAELRLVDGIWWIADLHSTNGLHFGGGRVEEHRLTHGDSIALAPDVHLLFFEAAPPQPGTPATSPTSAASPADEPHQRPWLLEHHPRKGAASAQPPAAMNAPAPPGAPVAPAPTGYPQYPAYPASAPLAAPAASRPAPAPRPLGPRSPFADDEEHFVPPGIAVQQNSQPIASGAYPGVPSSAAPGYPPTAPAPPNGGMRGPPQPTQPIQYMGQASISAQLPPGSRNNATIPAGSPGLHDPYLRQTGAPAQALLHVCQTCGQLTAPDALYCQNCHHSIAFECPNCRLSLLPVQDRCPRCQTPNPGSVRRAHRSPGG